MFTNGIDFLFHIYLGRALPPAGFAVVQTANSVLLVVVTAFAVLQPVVARFVAAATVEDEQITPRAIFQGYFRQSIILGIVLIAITFFLRQYIGRWLNIPVAAATTMSMMALLALTRPVVAGMLQGLQRFLAFGLTRTVYALARFTAVLVLIGILGGGAVAGVIAIPIGGLVALVAGLAFLGADVWKKTERVPRSMVLDGWRLSVAALLAYTAFMGLQNSDLIWVNRLFEADAAGAYASVVVLRRVVSVLPGAVIVIFYPRVVAKVTQGILPDSLLAKAAILVAGAGAVLTVLYFVLGPAIVDIIFGSDYKDAGAILGWMGVSMIGFGLGVIWLNLFLATRPWPFVAVLLAVLLGQTALLASVSSSIAEVTAIFGLSGWIIAIGGLMLYLGWLRPLLARQNEEKEIVDG